MRRSDSTTQTTTSLNLVSCLAASGNISHTAHPASQSHSLVVVSAFTQKHFSTLTSHFRVMFLVPIDSLVQSADENPIEARCSLDRGHRSPANGCHALPHQSCHFLITSTVYNYIHTLSLIPGLILLNELSFSTNSTIDPARPCPSSPQSNECCECSTQPSKSVRSASGRCVPSR